MQMQVLEEDIQNGKKLIAAMSSNLDPDVTPLLSTLRGKVREKEIMFKRCRTMIEEGVMKGY